MHSENCASFMCSVSAYPKVVYFGNSVCYNTCANFVLLLYTYMGNRAIFKK